MLTVLPAFRVVWDNWCVAQNFLSCDREQLWLMPPSVADWLPAGHLARFVVDVVDELDLSGFVSRYRVDGRGGAAYPPQVMVALIVYAYAVGELSSRKVQKRCVEDVAFRFVAANLVPDHATIARFRVTHAGALAGLFAQVLALCDKAGLIKAGLLAVDGTKMGANASREANRTAEQLAKDLLAAAQETDAAEDVLFGDGDGDQNLVPEAMTGTGRKARIREMLDELNAEAAAHSYEEHMRERAEKEAAKGGRLKGREPKPGSHQFKSRRHANMTDPQSRMQKVRGGGFIQGYNAQIIVTQDQFVVAAVVTNAVTDNAQFQPMLTAAKTNLRQTKVRRHRVRIVVADAGYWGVDNANTAGVEVFIAPGNARKIKEVTEREAARAAILDQVEDGVLPIEQAAEQLGVRRKQVTKLLKQRRDGTPSLTTVMAAKLATPRGSKVYKKRSASVEPVFAQIKHNRKIRGFSRRGLVAVDHEWKLIAATHNLLKLWRATGAAA
jgi:transposase